MVLLIYFTRSRECTPDIAGGHQDVHHAAHRLLLVLNIQPQVWKILYLERGYLKFSFVLRHYVCKAIQIQLVYDRAIVLIDVYLESVESL